MAMRGGWQRGERSPLLGRIQPRGLLSVQDCVGTSVDCGHVAVSHRSASALKTCEPKLLALAKSSICEEYQTTTPHGEETTRKFLRLHHKVKKVTIAQKYNLPPPESTVTWWTDYVFTPSMNMKHPSRFNPALLSHSARPITGLISVAGSWGWAYRSIRINAPSLWRRGWGSPLTGRSAGTRSKQHLISMWCIWSLLLPTLINLTSPLLHPSLPSVLCRALSGARLPTWAVNVVMASFC